MPIYEYTCESCGAQSEFWQSISEAPMTKCPHCGAETLKKIISLSSFQLKGSGWYATDYGRTNGNGKSNGTPAGAKPKSTDGDSAASSDSGVKADSTQIRTNS